MSKARDEVKQTLLPCLIAMALLLSGCAEWKLNHRPEQMEGRWTLQKFMYADSLGVRQARTDVQHITLLFQPRSKGILTTAGTQQMFSYNFGTTECSLAMERPLGLPLEAIGKIQLYEYALSGKNTVTFSTDFEYFQAGKQRLYNVSYTFTRQ